VIDGASEGGDCDEVICAGSVNQEESEQKEVVEMKRWELTICFFTGC